ncbi:MAG: hypothetical protein WCT14_05850, partial [Treponemataceae bacterium]
LVSDAEITEAGKYLGADFVVVAKVQRVADTYFLTAKMIAVKTGVIANQTSAENEGKLSILIKLAEKVGDVLSGGTVLAPAAADPKNRTAEPVIPVVEPVKPQPKPAADAQRIGLRVYVGIGGGTQDLAFNTFSDSFSPTGFDIYALWGLFGGIGVIGNVTFLDASSGAKGASVTSADVGLAYALPIGILMPWAGMKFGLASITWPEAASYTADGMEIAIDVGLDVRLGMFLAGARYQFQTVTFVKTGFYDVTSTQNTFWLMGGVRF